MNRRDFMQAAGMAATLALALAQRTAPDGPPATPSAKAGRVLPAGQDLFGATAPSASVT